MASRFCQMVNATALPMGGVAISFFVVNLSYFTAFYFVGRAEDADAWAFRFKEQETCIIDFGKKLQRRFAKTLKK